MVTSGLMVVKKIIEGGLSLTYMFYLGFIWVFSNRIHRDWTKNLIETKERKRTLHAYDMARRIVIEGTITYDRTLKAFPSIRHIPISFSTARIHPKVPVFLPNLAPYLLQCLHCTQFNFINKRKTKQHSNES